MSSQAKWIAFGFLLVFHAVVFLAAALALHKSVWAIAVPYLVTFVAPIPLFVLAVLALRKWETHKPPPKLLALCWSLCMAFLVAAVNGALFYYGLKFQIIHPSVGEVVFVMAACTLSASIPMYSRVLSTIVARANRLDADR